MATTTKRRQSAEAMREPAGIELMDYRERVRPFYRACDMAFMQRMRELGYVSRSDAGPGELAGQQRAIDVPEEEPATDTETPASERPIGALWDQPVPMLDAFPELRPPPIEGAVIVPVRITMRQIKREVASFMGVRVNEIDSTRRFPLITMARHIVMWRGKTETPLSFPQIAREVGGRDHTTVLHGCRKVQPLVDELGGWQAVALQAMARPPAYVRKSRR